VIKKEEIFVNVFVAVVLKLFVDVKIVAHLSLNGLTG
jgi:hypothetical protein